MAQCLRLVRGSRRGIALAALSVALAATPAPASADIGVLGGWGSLGSGNGQFTGASALTIDSAGDVYVVDGSFPTYNRVQKFTPAGAFITSFGNKGSEPDGFYGAGVAAATPSNIYVVDTFNKRIQQYTSTVPPTTYAHAATLSEAGTGDGQLVGPGGMAVDPSGNLYVADTGNERIQKFDKDGKFITKWGVQGSGPGEMNWPSDVSVAPDGSVYVTDTTNHRVQRWTSEGVFISQWGSAGSGDGQFVNPSAVATDSAGNVYVADADNDRIQKFTATGAFITKFGSFGAGAGQLNNPTDVAVNASGTIYVLDSGNNRVQMFGEGGVPISNSGVARPPAPPPTAKPKPISVWALIPPGPLCPSKNGQLCYVEILIPAPGQVVANTPLRGAGASMVAMRGHKTKAKPGIQPVRRQVGKSGKIRLRLQLNKAAKTIVRRKGKVAVRVQLTFTPKVGKAVSTTRTFTFKKKPKKQRAG
jgi:sugar lactone lactonase YvrE